FEPEDDAFLGHEPDAKLEVGLLVLRSVLATRVFALELEPMLPLVGRKRSLQNLVEDLGRALALEDSGVARLPEHVERRDDRDPDGLAVPRAVPLRKRRDDA